MSDTGVEKVAVVTGGASGIGLAIARRLAADGARTAIFDRDADAASSAAKAIAADGGDALAVPVDVADRASVERGAGEVRAAYGPVTILVNNAGVELFKPFLKIDLEAWERVLRVNLTGTYHCCQVLLPDMIEAGWGRIVNISSSSAQGGQPYMGAYVASKAGMIGLTKSLALEFGPAGVTVNTIPPSFIDTPMLRASEEKGRLGDTVEHHEGRTPVRRVGTPEDIAAACAFLVSDEASYVTGQVLGVNGGRVTG